MGGIKGIAYLPEVGYTSHMRVLIASKPKSGNHIIGNILQNMDLINSNYLIISEPGHDNLSFYVYDGIKYNKRFGTFPAKNIKDNNYLIGHISHTKRNVELFKDFKKINIFRDNDDVRKSVIRSLSESDGELIAKQKASQAMELKDNVLEKMDLWSTEPDVLHVKFDDLINKDIETIDKIQMYLFGHINFDSKYVIEKTLQDDSFSKHSSRK